MIHNILPVIGSRLNEYLRSEYELSEDRVVVSGLSDLKGNVPNQIDNRVVVSLVGIEEEASLQNVIPKGLASNPPVHINLTVLFAANFPDSNYIESLKFIASVVTFFQGQRVFNHQNTPMLSPNVDKVICEMVNLSYQEQNLLWSTLGVKFAPSVLYRFRTLAFHRGNILEEVPKVLGGEPPVPARKGRSWKNLVGAVDIDSVKRKNRDNDEA
jgi:hypothetical protein